jgi:hypothetical protein
MKLRSLLNDVKSTRFTVTVESIMNLRKLYKSLLIVCLTAIGYVFFFAFTSLTTNSDNYLRIKNKNNEKNVTNILFWIKYWNDPSE